MRIMCAGVCTQTPEGESREVESTSPKERVIPYWFLKSLSLPARDPPQKAARSGNKEISLTQKASPDFGRDDGDPTKPMGPPSCQHFRRIVIPSLPPKLRYLKVTGVRHTDGACGKVDLLAHQMRHHKRGFTELV